MDTVTDTLNDLRDRGYAHNFIASDGQVRCADCDRTVAPESVSADEIHRFEGSSDPDDSSVVIAVSEGPCGHSGALVLTFGPSADPATADVLRALDTER